MSFLDGAVTKWQPDRRSAISRLNTFVPSTGRIYAQRRNHDLGPDDRTNVSCLSPWIRHRAIHEREVLAATLARFSQSTAEKFVQEVFWRGYFKGWLEHYPSVWGQFENDLAALLLDLKTDTPLCKSYEEAICGKTGIDCFDFWARELAANNYLHNHARMWFASIWVFTLKLPWQLGAAFFLEHLLDGDPASNTLSWRWVAGLQTKGKTYCARADNISRFTEGRFDPKGQLSPFAESLIENKTYPRANLPVFQPCPAEGRFGLLISEEDCVSGSLNLQRPPSVIAVLSASSEIGSIKLSPAVLEFRNNLLSDAASRAEAHFQLQVILIEDQSPGMALKEWAQEHDLQTIVLSYPPVGAARKRLDDALPGLAEAGLEMHRLVRTYDQLVWPHATAGFFKLKKKIPRILQELAL
ncbi:MAG: FAD-binding domain-containing protein [Rhizobiaceae bacterium]